MLNISNAFNAISENILGYVGLAAMFSQVVILTVVMFRDGPRKRADDAETAKFLKDEAAKEQERNRYIYHPNGTRSPK